MLRKKIVPKIYASQAAFIDPGACDSTIAYTVTARRRLVGSINLSDCNRKIVWWFDNDDLSTKKIDKALEMLQNFRRDFLLARQQYKKKRNRKK
jgi:hypothetical protein